MNSSLSFQVISVTVIFLYIATVTSSAAGLSEYGSCNTTTPCGVLQTIEYPFWGGDRPSYCGHLDFSLRCPADNLVAYPFFTIGSMLFQVYSIDSAKNTMRLGQFSTSSDNVCDITLANTTLNSNHFTYVESADQNLTLFYNCDFGSNSKAWDNFTRCGRVYYADVDRLVNNNTDNVTPRNWCSGEINVTVSKDALERLHQDPMMRLSEAVSEGFVVKYKLPYEKDCSSCGNSGGVCGSDPDDTAKFHCIMRDSRLFFTTFTTTGASNTTRNGIIGGIVGAAGLFLMLVICCYYKIKRNDFANFSKLTKNEQDLEAFIINHGPLPCRRYSFTEVKTMTNSFREKLGSGGYGSVFKGKLHNNVLVAVKLLDSAKTDGEEFINEVAASSRTSHVNIVALLGYCIEGGNRALVYEFMPNGSLEKFIYSDNQMRASLDLGLEKVYQIALGIAQGLEYLHRGCKTRILHFDIKPHNVLLDEDFCPKISDFGLAKLSTNRESIVSMAGMRGTIGYIAPEVYSRTFGHVSHKSDVYSYGMMILEMVGRRKNANVGGHSSEIYFPNWIYDHLSTGEDFSLPSVPRDEENEIAKKMALVGLWCIQTSPSDRPSMGEVIDMLKGSVEALQLPPKPFITTPERSPPHSTSSLKMTQCDSTV